MWEKLGFRVVVEVAIVQAAVQMGVEVLMAGGCLLICIVESPGKQKVARGVRCGQWAAKAGAGFDSRSDMSHFSNNTNWTRS